MRKRCTKHSLCVNLGLLFERVWKTNITCAASVFLRECSGDATVVLEMGQSIVWFHCTEVNEQSVHVVRIIDIVDGSEHNIKIHRQ